MNDVELSDLVMRELITLSVFTKRKKLIPLIEQYHDCVELGYDPLQILSIMKEHYNHSREEPMSAMDLALHPCYMNQREELRRYFKKVKEGCGFGD